MKTCPTMFDTGVALHEAMLANWPFTWVSTRLEAGESLGGDLVELRGSQGADLTMRHILGDGVIIIAGQEHPATDIMISWRENDPAHDPIAEGVETYKLQAAHYALTLDDIKAMIDDVLWTNARLLYGPYEADPHAKGRRRRFRQRLAKRIERAALERK